MAPKRLFALEKNKGPAVPEGVSPAPRRPLGRPPGSGRSRGRGRGRGGHGDRGDFADEASSSGMRVSSEAHVAKRLRGHPHGAATIEGVPRRSTHLHLLFLRKVQ
jgi:hypothetical protein